MGLLALGLGVGGLVGCSGGSSSPCDGLCASTGGTGGAADGGAGAAGSDGGAAGSDGGAADATAGTSGAAGATAVTHCDVTNAGLHECIEYEVGYGANSAGGCAGLHGTDSPGTCDLTDSSGGCEQVFPGIGTLRTYFYLPTISSDDVMATCVADANATYIAP